MEVNILSRLIGKKLLGVEALADPVQAMVLVIDRNGIHTVPRVEEQLDGFGEKAVRSHAGWDLECAIIFCPS